jgi:hypothetical protein
MKGDIKLLGDSVIRALRERGYCVIRLDMSRQHEQKLDLYDFDLDCMRSLHVLASHLVSLQPQITYIHDQIETAFFLPRFIRRILSDTTLIWEPGDLAQFAVSNTDKLAQNKGWPVALADWTLHNEHANFHGCDGIVYKEYGSNVTDTLAHSQIPKLNLLPATTVPYRILPTLTLEPPFRLVYAGSLMAIRPSDPFNNNSYLLDVFRSLLGQNFSLDIFCNVESQSSRALLADYHLLADESTDFILHSRLVHSELLNRITGRYHFGLCLISYDTTRFRNDDHHLSTTFSAKAATYIAAGLPIVVSAELRAMSQFVLERGIGIAIPAADIGRFAHRLLDISADAYEKMRQQVLVTASELSAENQTPRIEEFLRIATLHRQNKLHSKKRD